LTDDGRLAPLEGNDGLIQAFTEIKAIPPEGRGRMVASAQRNAETYMENRKKEGLAATIVCEIRDLS